MLCAPGDVAHSLAWAAVGGDCQCIPNHLTVAAGYINLEERGEGGGGFREFLEEGIDTPGKGIVES